MIVLDACVMIAHFDENDVHHGRAGRLLADSATRERMRASASAFMAAHRGAIDRLWTWLAPPIAASSKAED